jgi:3-oxoacyl-[acyl-carrier protein] reductase
MDLGIAGTTAIVCAASQGLGAGCAAALADAGVHLVICARRPGPLSERAEALRARGVEVTPVPCDITTEAGRSAVLEACPTPDILVTNAGGPPPGDFADFDLDAWRAAVEANMLAPLALIRATAYGMADRGFGRIVNITSVSVKLPLPYLELSNGARAGLTGAVSALSRKLVAYGVTLNNLLPGMHATARVESMLTQRAIDAGSTTADETAKLVADIPARRLGDPADFGAVCAFLCSRQANFITGQNVVVDGGSFGGLL